MCNSKNKWKQRRCLPSGELVNKTEIQWNKCIQVLPFLSNGVPLFQRLLLWSVFAFPLEIKICYFWISALYAIFIYNWPIGFKLWFYFKTRKYSRVLFILSFPTLSSDFPLPFPCCAIQTHTYLICHTLHLTSPKFKSLKIPVELSTASLWWHLKPFKILTLYLGPRKQFFNTWTQSTGWLRYKFYMSVYFISNYILSKWC